MSMFRKKEYYNSHFNPFKCRIPINPDAANGTIELNLFQLEKLKCLLEREQYFLHQKPIKKLLLGNLKYAQAEIRDLDQIWKTLTDEIQRREALMFTPPAPLKK